MNKMIKRILAVILVTSMLLGSNGISYAAEVAAGGGTAGTEEVSLESEAGEQMESPGDSEEPAREESAREEPAVEEPKGEGSSTEAALPEEGAAEEFDEETNAVAGEQIDAADVVAEPAKAEAPMGASEPDEGTAPLLREENVSHSANLADFLTDVEIDAPLNDDGTAYKVEPGIPYAIELKFKEKPNLQFDNDVLTYNIPTGLNADGHSGSISVTVQRGDQEYTISNNTFSVENGVLTLTWNQSDPNFHQLTAAANIDFEITLSGVFTEEATHIQFSDEISKDVEFEKTNKVRTYKEANVDIVDDRVYYTATVESFGTSQNVVVTDTITGTGLTLDPNSISFESSTGQPVSATGTASGNSFTYTIPRMANQEVITITYSAIIDPSQLRMVNGRVVTQSHNKIKATSEGDPEGHETEVDTEVSYTPSIFKGVATELVDQQDGTVKKLLWTVFVNGDPYGNNPPKVSAAGTVVTDTINEIDRDIMKYSGTGITVRVTDAQGRLVRTDTIPYGQLDAYSDYSWQYTIPQSDAGYAYRYEITYTTDVETADLTLWRQLGNVVVTNGGQTDWGAGEVVPEGGIIDINKTVTKIDKKNMEVSWETIVDVPKNGLPRAIVYDVYPTATSANGETLVERIKPDTV